MTIKFKEPWAQPRSDDVEPTKPVCHRLYLLYTLGRLANPNLTLWQAWRADQKTPWVKSKTKKFWVNTTSTGNILFKDKGGWITKPGTPDLEFRKTSSKEGTVATDTILSRIVKEKNDSGAVVKSPDGSEIKLVGKTADDFDKIVEAHVAMKDKLLTTPADQRGGDDYALPVMKIYDELMSHEYKLSGGGHTHSKTRKAGSLFGSKRDESINMSKGASLIYKAIQELLQEDKPSLTKKDFEDFKTKVDKILEGRMGKAKFFGPGATWFRAKRDETTTQLYTRIDKILNAAMTPNLNQEQENKAYFSKGF